MKPDVSHIISIIVPCLNCTPYLVTLLNCLNKQSLKIFELIVVDNGSIPPIIDTLRTHTCSFPIHVLRFEYNLGYANGVNTGIANCTSPFILVLNADIILPDDFFKKCHPHMNTLSDSDPKILSFWIKHKNHNTCSAGVCLTRFLRGKESTEPNEILGPQGAAFLFHRHVLSILNRPHHTLFDEKYFFLWEDIELGIVLSKKHIPTKIVPGVQLMHTGNATGFDASLRQALSFRNRMLLIMDHFPDYLTEKWFALVIYDIPRILWMMCTNSYKTLILTWTHLWLKYIWLTGFKKEGGFLIPPELPLPVVLRTDSVKAHCIQK